MDFGLTKVSERVWNHLTRPRGSPLAQSLPLRRQILPDDGFLKLSSDSGNKKVQ